MIEKNFKKLSRKGSDLHILNGRSKADMLQDLFIRVINDDNIQFSSDIELLEWFSNQLNLSQFRHRHKQYEQLNTYHSIYKKYANIQPET